MIAQLGYRNDNNKRQLGEIITAIVSAVIAATNFIIRNMDKDNELIAMRDNVLRIFRANKLSEADISKYLTTFKLRHADIKNVKIFSKSGYAAEWKRLYEMVYKIVSEKFPRSLNPFLKQLEDTENPVPLSTALEYAIQNPEILSLTPGSTGSIAIVAGAALVSGLALWWMLSD